MRKVCKGHAEGMQGACEGHARGCARGMHGWSRRGDAAEAADRPRMGRCAARSGWAASSGWLPRARCRRAASASSAASAGEGRSGHGHARRLVALGKWLLGPGGGDLVNDGPRLAVATERQQGGGARAAAPVDEAPAGRGAVEVPERPDRCLRERHGLLCLQHLQPHPGAAGVRLGQKDLLEGSLRPRVRAGQRGLDDVAHAQLVEPLLGRVGRRGPQLVQRLPLLACVLLRLGTERRRPLNACEALLVLGSHAEHHRLRGDVVPRELDAAALDDLRRRREAGRPPLLPASAPVLAALALVLRRRLLRRRRVALGRLGAGASLGFALALGPTGLREETGQRHTERPCTDECGWVGAWVRGYVRAAAGGSSRQAAEGRRQQRRQQAWASSPSASCTASGWRQRRLCLPSSPALRPLTTPLAAAAAAAAQAIERRSREAVAMVLGPVGPGPSEGCRGGGAHRGAG